MICGVLEDACVAEDVVDEARRGVAASAASLLPSPSPATEERGSGSDWGALRLMSEARGAIEEQGWGRPMWVSAAVGSWPAECCVVPVRGRCVSGLPALRLAGRGSSRSGCGRSSQQVRGGPGSGGPPCAGSEVMGPGAEREKLRTDRAAQIGAIGRDE